VGSYAIMKRTGISSGLSPNSNYSGSSIEFTGFNQLQTWQSTHDNWNNGPQGSGTWRSMASVGGFSNWYAAGLFVRIS